MTQPLWQEIDRVALCIHRPTGSSPQFRELAQRVPIPGGSVIVAAARHVAAGKVTLQQLELLSRYESRSLVRMNAERHVELGLFEQVGDGEFVPTPVVRDAARAILELQASSAAELWAGCGDLVDLAALASSIVARALASAPVPTPALAAEVDDHRTTPLSPAGQLLASVTELRYLRSDLHAHALERYGLAGPTARAVDRMWKEHPLSDDDIGRLERAALVSEQADGWRLTEDARHGREQAEADTERLTAAALGAVSDVELSEFHQGLVRLPGDDPRPPGDR